jgi:AhpD family alkylhydroperoxidase
VTRQEIYDDIEETYGEVPSFLQRIPDDRALELEWGAIKHFEMEEGPIPAKYREFIALALVAASGCDHCVYYTRETAKLAGATDEELDYVAHYGKFIIGWTTFINGLGLPLDEFKEEMGRIFARARRERETAKPERRAA